MSDCIFCKIIQGQIPCAKVYEDADIIAFLDINPFRPGHTLVVPKPHTPTLFDLQPEQSVALVRALQKIGKAVMEASGADGLNVFQNNYPAAGQTVFHAHWHLIPRHKDDGLQFWGQGTYESPDAMQNMADSIMARLR